MTVLEADRYLLAAEPRDPYLGVGLWKRRDLVVLATLYLLGALGLLASWYGSAEEADWRDNTRWLVTSTGAVSLAGLGLLAWLLAGRFRIGAARRVVARGLLERRQSRSAGAAAPVADLVTAAGMRRYHRPSCLLMADKQALPADRARLEPCGVCEP